MAAQLSREILQVRVMALISERVLETGAGFSPQSDLYAAGLDSLAIMQLLLALEEEFGLSIPVESVSRKNFSTPGTIVEMLEGRLGVETAPDADPPAAPPDPKPEESSLAPAASQPVSFTRQPLKGCDYFVLCFDAMSRRTGQGGHKAHSFLVLDRLPDVARLREALRQSAERYPMLSAQLVRKWLFGPPEWRPAAEPVAPELHLYSETGSEGSLLALGGESCADAQELMTQIVNTPLPRPGEKAWPKARFSLIERKEGGAVLVFSWSHLMLDGVGAELFLKELDADLLAAGVPQMEPACEIESKASLQERWQAARPVVQKFNRLAEQKLACLGPARPVAGPTFFEIHTLTEEQTVAVKARSEQMVGNLVNMPFYLACAMRAHEHVMRRRGLSPGAQACSVPVQTRRKGAAGPLFQNHVTMFFGALPREELASLEASASALMRQHADFVKNRLGDALNGLMQAMRVMPPGLYWQFISLQMRGPFASFFHSHTGEFAPGLNEFFGARILNAYHVPGIATPPGTGIFCNEKNGRLVITLCWHEMALSAEERKRLMEHFLRDLGLE